MSEKIKAMFARGVTAPSRTPTMPTEREELVERLRELRAFLSGSGELDGLWFGDTKLVTRTRQGAFWWREHLDRIDQAAEALTALDGGGISARSATQGHVRLSALDPWLAHHIDLSDASDPTPPEEEGEMFYGHITIAKARELNAILSDHPSDEAATSGLGGSGAFTPGPWVTETTARFVWIGPRKTWAPKVADVVTGIACDGLTDEAEARVFANARLIAAAPDLLEACQDAAITFRRYEVMHREKRTVEGEQKAVANGVKATRCEAAIAKALGPETKPLAQDDAK